MYWTRAGGKSNMSFLSFEKQSIAIVSRYMGHLAKLLLWCRINIPFKRENFQRIQFGDKMSATYLSIIHFVGFPVLMSVSLCCITSMHGLLNILSSDWRSIGQTCQKLNLKNNLTASILSSVMVWVLIFILL